MDKKLTSIEIKEGLKACSTGGSCEECPLGDDNSDTGCKNIVNASAVELLTYYESLIDSLSEDLGEEKSKNYILTNTYEMKKEKINELKEQIKKVTFEAYDRFAYELMQIPRVAVLKYEIRDVLKELKEEK